MKQTRIWNYSLLALFLLCQLAFFLNGERRIKREVERTVPINPNRSLGFGFIGNSDEEQKRIKNDVGSQLASMGCVPRHNTTDCPAY